MNKLITDYEKKTTVEIAIVSITTSSTSKEKFDDLSLYIAKSWGVGKKVKNNGILIAISNGYSKIRIQNGLGIEKIISDETTKKVIDEKMISSFKESNYFEGLKNGVIELIRILDKEELSSKYDDSLISQLANKEITSLDSNNSVYWEIIKRSEKSIPSLIESLCDTTLTSIYDKCKG
ncbi:MAG: TPM domain-containing protein, partial [Fluviicola sp.]